MKKIFIVIAFIISFVCNVQAKLYDTINLVDGTVIHGYISNQIPGDNMTIKAAWMQLTLSDTVACITDKRTVAVDGLNESWEKLLKAYPKFVKDVDGKKMLTVGTLKYQKPFRWNEFSEGKAVKIIGEGVTVKVIFPLDEKCSIKTSDILTIRRSIGDTLEDGVQDEVTTTTIGTVKGYIIEQKPGSYIKVQKKNGTIEEISYKNIIRKEICINDETVSELIKKIGYKDVVTSSHGTYEGIIKSQTYGQAENIITVIGEDDIEKSIRVSDVREVSRYPVIKPVKKTVRNITKIKDTSVRIGNIIMEWNGITENRRMGDFYATESQYMHYITLRDEKAPLNIYYNDTEENKSVKLYSVKPVGRGYYGISKMQVSASGMECDAEETEAVDNVIFNTYKLKAGHYLLLRKTDGKCILFEVKL